VTRIYANLTPRECEQCKNPFVPTNGSTGRFCSRKCFGAYRTAQRKRVPCAWCGKTVEHRLVRSQGHTFDYCSPDCVLLHRESLRPTLTERFWKNVSKPDDPDGCWIWVGHFDQEGYGRINVRLEGGRRVLMNAHRLSWELHNGPIPDGMSVLHDCPGGDRPDCVRPSHLWLGTQLDNIRDRDSKGRSARGERCGNAKTTEAKVIEIRRRYAAGGISQVSLALEFNLSPSHIHAIISGTRWKHVK
jgi:endogenous inhibitor of DNA gyrase (YacG/DUF329 family)